MSLLRRMAISRGNKARQTAAHELLAALDRRVVSQWHKDLRGKLNRRVRVYEPPRTSYRQAR